MNQLKQFYERLTPKGKMILAIVGTVVILGTIVGVAMDAAAPKRKDRIAAKPTIEAILTDSDPRSIGIDSMAAQIKQLQAQQTRIERSLSKFDTEESKNNLADKLVSLEAQLAELQKEMLLRNPPPTAGSEKKPSQSDKSSEPTSVGEGSSTPEMKPIVSKATDSSTDLSKVYQNLPPSPPIDPKARTSEKASAPKLRTIRSETKEKQEEKKQDISFTLPAGTLFSGVLVTGMDAPTGRQAQKDPFPSLLRIKNEAILPNRFRADFRECFMIAGGWGDLSSERAYLRSERLSCVRNDGTVLESTIDSYATGEDGKAGVRGRLVSKQGQMLVRTLMAGFMQGAASVFQVAQVPTLNLSSGDGSQKPLYQQALSKENFQAALATGTGTALERLADFYMDMAENMFPVIEIDAMREVNFIVTRGMTLKFNENTLKVNSVNE